MLKNIKKLLFLEIEVEKLDSTKLTCICDKAERCLQRYEERQLKQNLTPIEQIMDVILLAVDSKIGDFLSITDRPHIWVVPQKKVGKYKADFEISFVDKSVDKKYIIECDGHDFHEKTKEQVAYDKKRERFFVKNGYRVLRFSGSEIYNDFEKIKNELFELFLDDIESGVDYGF